MALGFTCFVRLHTLLRVVERCCAKFDSGLIALTSRQVSVQSKLMRFAWRTETMVLPDHKVGITEQSQGCYKCKHFQKLSLREELRTPVQRFTLFPGKQAVVKIHEHELWLSHIAILHSWCNFSLSCNPFFEFWISLSVVLKTLTSWAQCDKTL